MTPPRCDEDVTGSISTAKSCAVWFAQIEASVRELSRQVEGMAEDVKELTKQVLVQGQSLSSAWETIKTDIVPNIRESDKSISEAITDHEDSCPAHRKAMKRAEGGNGNGSDTRMPVYRRDSSVFNIPKWVVYLGVGLGVALAVCGLVIFKLFS
jgi:hypothetical protein